MAESEIKRILQQIRQEEEAARRGLEGTAITGKHAFINAKVENMGRYYIVLAEMVGSKEAAMELIVADQKEGDSNIKNVTL